MKEKMAIFFFDIILTVDDICFLNSLMVSGSWNTP